MISTLDTRLNWSKFFKTLEEATVEEALIVIVSRAGEFRSRNLIKSSSALQPVKLVISTSRSLGNEQFLSSSRLSNQEFASSSTATSSSSSSSSSWWTYKRFIASESWTCDKTAFETTNSDTRIGFKF